MKERTADGAENAAVVGDESPSACWTRQNFLPEESPRMFHCEFVSPVLSALDVAEAGIGRDLDDVARALRVGHVVPVEDEGQRHLAPFGR